MQAQAPSQLSTEMYLIMAKVFDSTSKRLAIPLFALFPIGWIVITDGFILLFKSDLIFDDNDNIARSPVYFPLHLFLVGGQFVALLGLLHAALPSGIPSSIIGALSTILNTIYFVFVGYLITASCLIILYFKLGKYFESDDNPQLQFAVGDDAKQKIMRVASLILAGSITLVVSWSLIQFVCFFYERRSQPVRTRKLWYVIAECWKNRTMLSVDVSESVRLASILAMLLSAIGWGTFMGGLFNMYLPLKMTYILGGWSAILITPFMYPVSLFHAGCTRTASTVLGIVASILNTFFIVGMGFSVTFAGQFLYLITEFPMFAAGLEAAASSGGTPGAVTIPKLDVEEMKKNSRLMLGGGLVCLIFWTVVLVLWQFYLPKGTLSRYTKNGMNSKDYDYHPLLPFPSSVTKCTESHDTMDQCRTEAEATTL